MGRNAYFQDMVKLSVYFIRADNPRNLASTLVDFMSKVSIITIIYYFISVLLSIMHYAPGLKMKWKNEHVTFTIFLFGNPNICYIFSRFTEFA